MTIKQNQRIKGRLLNFIVASCFGISNSAIAQQNVEQSTQLSISPQQCVALHQGQVCYQSVQIQWQANQKQNYCLFDSTKQQPIRCWKSSIKGEHRFDFQSDKSVVYQLRIENQTQVIAESSMTVAWVYGQKKRRRASWRLF